MIAGMLALSVSCLRDTSYRCSASSECGTGGTCESGIGYCSVSDSTCPSGARFTPSAGSYANQCVGADHPNDAQVADAPASDAPIDAAITGCPTPYATITGGQGTHRYQVILMTDSWQNQRAFCTATSSSAYLAIPDDLNELNAIATLSAASASWVGISDTVTENMFQTVKNVPATYLPWAGGQPDDQGPGEDCVIIETNGSRFRDERCNTKFRAVCECEP
ncbi:hypothetical protein BH11MYX3_BH11MYX3_24440 [soil metagenome]